MPSIIMQVLILCIISLIQTDAVKPPGYVEPKKETDPNSPKYEYGYNIANEEGGEQGKQEQRDGIHASGRYFVQGKESTQEVQYFADDWGYHPAVEYSSVGPYSRSSARFALDHEAVQQLKNKENNQPQLEGLPDTGNLNKQGSQISLEKLRESTNNLKEIEFQTQPTLLQSTISQNLQIVTQKVPQQHQGDFKQPQQNSQPIQEKQIIQFQPQQKGSSQASHHDLLLADSFTQFLSQLQPQAQPLTQHISTPQNSFIQENLVQSDEKHIQNSVGSLGQYEQGKELRENLIFHQEQQQVSNVGATLQNYQPQHQSGEIKNQFNYHESIVVHQNGQNKFQSGTASPYYANSVIQPQKLVQLDDYMNEYAGKDGFPEFGLKINAVTNDGTSKLVESTQHLVSGQDVLDINGAITNYQESNIKINSQETDTEYKTSDVTSVSTTTPADLRESGFNDHPIVVADSFETDVLSSTANVELNQQEETYSTTAKAISTISSTSSPLLSTIVVTPRPLSTTFLAPITAGIRLQNVEQYSEEQQEDNKQNVRVEIQASIPYYLGKYEYPLGYGQQITNNQSSILNIDEKAKENIDLGKTLLYFPGQSVSFENQPIADVDNHITLQQLPRSEIKNHFSDVDQQQAQGYQQQVTIQQSTHVTPAPEQVTKIILQQLPRTEIKNHFSEVDQQQAQGYQQQVTIQQSTHVTPAPEHVTKIIHKPYPVEVPYPVIKQVQIPTTIHKFIEKPIHITRYVEKPVRIPQPYPVEKVVEKPVHIPVQVTKYIDRPYPVEVRVPYPQPYPVDRVVEKIVKQPYTVEKPVTHYVDRPYPVEKIVEKKVPHYVDRPYRVEVKVPVEKIVEKPVPHYIDRPYRVEVKVPVEKIVEKIVPQYVDRPYPVEKIVEKPVPHYIDRPYPVEKIVEKPVPHYIDRPYPVEVKVHVPQQYYVNGEGSKPQKPYYAQINTHVHHPDQPKYQTKEQHVQQSQPKLYFIANPYAYAPQINRYLPPVKQFILNNGYLPTKQISTAYLPSFQGNSYLPPKQGDLKNPAVKPQGCGYHQPDSNVQQYDNTGLLPPRVGNGHQLRTYRNARSHFDNTNVRMEYGFLPPMNPSLEIDDRGNPIESSDK